MTAGVLAHHALLVAALAGLGGAGVRVASRVAGGGLERVLVAFTLACAAAVCESLGLGLVALGGSSVALATAALATWAVTALVAPRPAVPVHRELVAWIAAAGRPAAAAIGGLAGLVVTWTVWQLVHPLVGGDGLIYHLPIASAWVQNGRPGSIVNVLDGLSVANYPVTNEVLVSWGLGLSRSWVVGSIWSVGLLVVLAVASWVALRALAVGLGERILGIVALCVMPLVVAQLCGPDTDIAALAWLVVTAALALGALERPALILPAVIAAGLCIGTKTTPGILIVGLAVIARHPLAVAWRERRAVVLGSLGVAVVVGGVWSLRDVIVHGSPFWPLEAFPWGTPVQASLVPLEPSFLSDPRGLLANHGADYLRTLAGALVLIGGGLLAAALRRSRPAIVAGGLAVVALLAWSVSPYTGIEAGDFAAGATRYLLPAIAACTVALVLCARGAGRPVRLALDAVLVASIAWSVLETARLGGQFVPGPLALGVGVAGGLGAGLLATWSVASACARRRPGAAARAGGRLAAALAGGSAVVLGVGLAVALAVGLAAAGDGYVARHARTGEIDGPVLKAGLAGLAGGSGPVAEGPATVVMLRGDHLDHPLAVIGDGESCASLRDLVAREPVVLQGEPPTPFYARMSACLRGIPPAFTDTYVDVYG
ncbi:MAG TPA: hypothetical protein VG165_02305 [Solirubrobacteraceae bacterium]|jgi:hypothetical protein|nr:hypothetical protein [Solirubrobacteraceae bacterium]